MPGRTFLDTNVLVYALDDADPDKKQTARALLTETADVVVSAQVLSEFYVTITRKLQPTVPPETAIEMVRRLARLPCVAIDAELAQLAIEAGRRWRLSHWDALVIEAARQAGCTRILTEDLSAGAVYHGLAIENPF